MSELQVEARLSKVDGEPSPWQLESHEITKPEEPQNAAETARMLQLQPEDGECASEPLHVTQARRIARAIFNIWGVRQGMSETAELLISEMLANAAEHKEGNGIERMTVTWHRSREMGGLVLEILRIEVANRTSAATVPATHPTLPDEFSESGRGLPLVEMLSHDWGQEMHEKSVEPTIVTHATLQETTTDRIEVAA